MAELASSLPTSGAMYHWASKLGGKGWGWFTAWFNIIGQLAALAGIDYGCALFVTPLLGLDATTTKRARWSTACILLSHALINHFGIRLVAWLNDFSVTVHIVGVIAIVGALLLFAPKQPRQLLLRAESRTTLRAGPTGGRSSSDCCRRMWTFTGYDASASVSEETVDPRRRAPWGMVMAVVVSSVVGYLLLIALTLAIKDIPRGARRAGRERQCRPGGDRDSDRRRSASGPGRCFAALAAMAMWFCGLSAVTWCSRVI